MSPARALMSLVTLAGIAILIAAVLSGYAQNHLTITVMIAAGVLLAVVVTLNPDEGSQPMPNLQRRFLALYFLGLANVLVYAVLMLFSVQFPDLQTNPSMPPTLLEQANTAAGPALIVNVVPGKLPANLGTGQLQLFGDNLGKATVTVNGSAREARHVGEQLLVVPLISDDTATGANVALAVRIETKTGETVTPVVLQANVPVVAQTGFLRVLGRDHPITRETQLLLLAIVAGALGSYIHAIRSFADFVGNRTLVSSWFLFYVTKPFIGVALAIVFYAAIRGGFVAGSPADVKSVNPFGVFAVAGLVGMFADRAGEKLKEIFEALFKAGSQREDPVLGSLSITTSSLSPAQAGQPYAAAVAAKGGKPPYKWSLAKAPTWLTINEDTGVLRGMPTVVAAGQSFDVSVTDSEKATSAQPLTIEVKT